MCGLYLHVVFTYRSMLYMIRTVCSEKGGPEIQVVFLDSGHIIQVSLYKITKSLNILVNDHDVTKTVVS